MNERTYDGMTAYEKKRNAWAVLENRIAGGEITEAEAKALLESEPDICGSCGSDLRTDEHDADCPFYSYGGEDGRDG
jgi:hypothetical protein